MIWVFFFFLHIFLLKFNIPTLYKKRLIIQLIMKKNKNRSIRNL